MKTEKFGERQLPSVLDHPSEASFMCDGISPVFSNKKGD